MGRSLLKWDQPIPPTVPRGLSSEFNTCTTPAVGIYTSPSVRDTTVANYCLIFHINKMKEKTKGRKRRDKQEETLRKNHSKTHRKTLKNGFVCVLRSMCLCVASN